jgi:S1-C subfamily serine protease
MTMRPLFLMLLAGVVWVSPAARADGTDAPKKLEPYQVHERPLGFVGVRRATVSLRLLQALVGKPSVETLEVNELDPNSPALLAGVQKGDLITAINGRPITEFTLSGLKHMGDSLSAGDHMAIDVQRKGEKTPRHVEFVLGSRPPPGT